METCIHPTAIIHPSAHIQEGCSIGPYCVIGSHVTLAKGCKLESHVVIDGHSTIGESNHFYPFSAIGTRSQDLKYAGEPTRLIIGTHNTFRENTTVHCSTGHDIPTTIGNHNLFLSYTHVAHDCQVGNHCIFSNNATLGGHATVDDYAILSGFAGVHQFCRIGQHAMIGGCTKIVQDVAPFTLVDGNPALTRGLNLIGLSRRGFSAQSIALLKRAYRKLFLKKRKNLSTQLEALCKDASLLENNEINLLVTFIQQSQRGITR